MKTYHTIFVICKTSSGHMELDLHDVTEERALQMAKKFGYIAPKWYEFWKSKIRFVKIEY